jgi:hypothetical protein
MGQTVTGHEVGIMGRAVSVSSEAVARVAGDVCPIVCLQSYDGEGASVSFAAGNRTEMGIWFVLD